MHARALIVEMAACGAPASQRAATPPPGEVALFDGRSIVVLQRGPR